MLKWWQRFSERPQVAHLLRAIDRFNIRGGSQLSAALAYFSVLSLIPVLMLLFSGIGLTLTVLMPDALTSIETWILEQFTNEDVFGQQIADTLRTALSGWAAVGGIGLAVSFWVGSGWVGNLKRAVRILMREDVDNPGKQLPLPLDVLANFAGLLALFVGILATFAVSSGATTLFDYVGEALGIQQNPVWSAGLRIVGLLISVVAGTALFRLLFAWFSPRPLSTTRAWVGSAIGSTGLLVLQLSASYLISAFSRNPSAALFAPIIVLMLFLNLFGSLILFIASWLATEEAPPPLAPPEVLAGPEEPVEEKPGQLYVSARVAERSMGAGLKAGYVIGTATGLGLGAGLLGVLRALSRKKPE